LAWAWAEIHTRPAAKTAATKRLFIGRLLKMDRTRGGRKRKRRTDVSPEPPAPRCSWHLRWAVTGTVCDYPAPHSAESRRIIVTAIFPASLSGRVVHVFSIFTGRLRNHCRQWRRMGHGRPARMPSTGWVPNAAITVNGIVAIVRMRNVPPQPGRGLGLNAPPRVFRRRRPCRTFQSKSSCITPH
jgi:hypothetical protein